MFCQRNQSSPTFVSKIFFFALLLKKNLDTKKETWLYVKTLRKNICHKIKKCLLLMNIDIKRC